MLGATHCANALTSPAAERGTNSFNSPIATISKNLPPLRPDVFY